MVCDCQHQTQPNITNIIPRFSTAAKRPQVLPTAQWVVQTRTNWAWSVKSARKQTRAGSKLAETSLETPSVQGPRMRRCLSGLFTLVIEAAQTKRQVTSLSVTTMMEGKNSWMCADAAVGSSWIAMAALLTYKRYAHCTGSLIEHNSGLLSRQDPVSTMQKSVSPRDVLRMQAWLW